MKKHLNNSSNIRAAFSLVETLVATGIIATALTGSLSMMAVGLGQSRESVEKSRAAMLAQEVHADFRIGSLTEQPAAADTRFTKPLLPLVGSTFAGVALVFDESFRLVGQEPMGAQAFPGGAPMIGAAFIVTISGVEDMPRALARSSDALNRAASQASQNLPLGGLPYVLDEASPATSVTSSTNVPISRDVITVEAPATAPAATRKRYRYEFLRQF